MPSDDRTPNEIERDIERERAELSRTVDELQDRFSPEAIMRSVARGFSDHGGDVGTAISKSVKQNPVALALTGAGLAWLMFGRSYDDRPDSDLRERYQAPTRSADDANDENAYGQSRGVSSYGSANRASGTPRRAYGEADTWAYADDDWDDDDDDSLISRASESASNAGQKMSQTGSAAAGAVRSGASSAAEAASSGASAVGAGAKLAANTVASGASAAAGGVSDAASATARRAARMRQRLAEGTENMSEAARERVIAARSKFIETRNKADAAARRHASRGADAVGDFIEEQPLVAGALALAVGAALAGALPRTKAEDDMLGERSDALYDEAERIFHSERRKAESVAKAAMSEASSIAEEKRAEADNAADGSNSAIQSAANEVREAGRRVVDAAKDKADEQDLGKPKV